MQKLANNDHIRHGPVVGGDPARAGHCLREQAQAKTSTASESFGYRAFMEATFVLT
jgi:hypothetical protein